MNNFFDTCLAYWVEVSAWTEEDIIHHFEHNEDYYPETWEGIVVGLTKEKIKNEIEKRFRTDDIVHLDYSLNKMICSPYAKDCYCTSMPTYEDYLKL